MIPAHKRQILQSIVIILIIGVVLFVFQGMLIRWIMPQSSYDVSFGDGTLSIYVPIPDSPDNMSLYRVIPGENAMIDSYVPNMVMIRKNVTKEADAPLVAQRVLSDYGGLPDDAVLISSSTQYAEKTSESTTTKYPVMTQVQYSRQIDGFPVMGPGGTIRLSFGENDELLQLYKNWRSVNRSHTVQVIPAKTALEKLSRREMIGFPMSSKVKHYVDSMVLGYYEKGFDETQEFLEPVWVFSGSTSSGDSWSYSVYARLFANFTATPAALNVQFTDTSDTPPLRWQWDFDDGATSTLQDPKHTYNKAGTYNVTLTTWNDLGSDMIMKQVQVP